MGNQERKGNPVVGKKSWIFSSPGVNRGEGDKEFQGKYPNRRINHVFAIDTGFTEEWGGIGKMANQGCPSGEKKEGKFAQNQPNKRARY